MTELQTPMFLMSINDLDEYNNKFKSPTHASFYNMVKNKLNIFIITSNILAKIIHSNTEYFFK